MTRTAKKPSAKIIPMPVKQKLVCSECGAGGEGSCRCGAAYVPAGQRAADAVTKNPEMSDRAIAADLGVSHTTVQKARKATGNKLPVEEKRTGRDGRTRKVPEPKPVDPLPKPKKIKPADTTKGDIHQQVTALYMELKNFSNDYVARLNMWMQTHPNLDHDSKVGLIEVLEDTSMSLQRLAQAVDDR